MAYYRDTTAAVALGNVEREMKERRKEAKHAAQLLREGNLTAEQEQKLLKRFAGIYRRVLNEELYGAAA